jgi:hypothetical protein
MSKALSKICDAIYNIDAIYIEPYVDSSDELPWPRIEFYGRDTAIDLIDEIVDEYEREIDTLRKQLEEPTELLYKNVDDLKV